MEKLVTADAASYTTAYNNNNNMKMNSHFQNIDNIFKSVVKNIIAPRFFEFTGPH